MGEEELEDAAEETSRQTRVLLIDDATKNVDDKQSQIRTWTNQQKEYVIASLGEYSIRKKSNF